jgi:predicted Zn-dependent protease with MMP-like domain
MRRFGVGVVLRRSVRHSTDAFDERATKAHDPLPERFVKINELAVVSVTLGVE